MVTKKPNLISIPLHDLLECLVKYSEYLDTPPPYADIIPDDEVQSIKRRFTLDTPKQKLYALETILFGDGTITLKRGNKGFRENDIKILLEVKKEKGDTLKTKEAFLNECAQLVQIRNPDVDDGSVKRRIDDVYQMLKKEGWGEPASEYHEIEGLPNSDNMREEYFKEEMMKIAPWLNKYRKEILNYYSTYHEQKTKRS